MHPAEFSVVALLELIDTPPESHPANHGVVSIRGLNGLLACLEGMNAIAENHTHLMGLHGFPGGPFDLGHGQAVEVSLEDPPDAPGKDLSKLDAGIPWLFGDGGGNAGKGLPEQCLLHCLLVGIGKPSDVGLTSASKGTTEYLATGRPKSIDQSSCYPTEHVVSPLAPLLLHNSRQVKGNVLDRSMRPERAKDCYDSWKLAIACLRLKRLMEIGHVHKETLEGPAGTATLYRGDCRAIAPAIQADMIFTDPPYGHNNNNNDLIHKREKALGRSKAAASARPIQNDSPELAHELAEWLFNTSPKLLKSGGIICCCCCGGGGPDPQFARWALMIDKTLAFKQMIVWDKGPMGMGWHYRRSYETILVASKKGAKPKWHDASGKIENIIRPGQHGISKIIPDTTQHPTEKPWQLAAHFIRLHSLPGETILDPFMGSGSTGIAALKLNRDFIGIELDPHHLQAAKTRIQQTLAEPQLFTEPPQITTQAELL